MQFGLLYIFKKKTMKHFLILILLFVSVHLKAQHTLHFTIELAEVNATEKIYNFIVDDFDQIIAWQLTFLFDSTNMRFKEVRNSVIDGLSNSDFNEAEPGVLFTTWLDSDVFPNDYSNPVTAFQMVFDVLQPGGSALCFSTDEAEYEIVLSDGTNDFALDNLIITDECNTDLLLVLNPSAVENTDHKEKYHLEKLFLSTSGELSFTMLNDQAISFVLYDIPGHVVGVVKKNEYALGRHTVHVRKTLQSGIYFINIINEAGVIHTLGVYTY